MDAAARRQELWRLLGDLPDRDAPVRAEKVSEEPRDGYVLEKVLLHLNGIEPVPAWFCRAPAAPAPVVIYNHAHGGGYRIGKDEAIRPREFLQTPPYGEALAAMGFHTLCIDHWVFGERSGRTESSVFKEMLWKGQVMWGMMVFDTVRATDYAASRPDVDASRIASLGMSMGSTMAWWHAALDERVKVCVDICCLTDFHALIESGGLDGHGIYYYVPSLLKHFDTAGINALIAPRAHLSLAGTQDPLTPVKGLDRVDAALREVYAAAGAPGNWKLLRFESGHRETPEMRSAALDWLLEKLQASGGSRST